MKTIPLPPAELRQGGTHFLEDGAFVRHARADVGRLARHCRLRPWSNVLDLGCGPGRLAVGLMHTWWFRGLYIGVEVQERHVDWCNANLANRRYRFQLIDVANERYNPTGTRPARLPCGDGEIGAFHAFSVFTHMRSSDVAAYLFEIARVLKPRGRAFFSAFVEPNVEDEVENPPGYLQPEWRNPLHCVRFSIEHLERMVGDAGLQVVQFSHRSTLDGQSEVYVTRERKRGTSRHDRIET